MKFVAKTSAWKWPGIPSGACLSTLLALGYSSAGGQVLLPERIKSSFAPLPSLPQAFPVPKGREWPQKVGLAGIPQVVADKSAKAGSGSGKSTPTWFVYHTDHFQMLCNQELAPSALREMGRLLESTWQLNCVLPLNWEPTVPDSQARFTIRIFARTHEYQAAKGPAGTGGVYLADRKEVLIPARSLGADRSRTSMTVERQTEDQGTLVHEVTHLMMHAWLENLPLWLSEGAAEYVSAADYSAGEFRLKHHLHHVRERIQKRLATEADARVLAALPLKEFLKMNGADWQKLLASGKAPLLYGTALAVTAYFYHGDGPKRRDGRVADPEKMPIFAFIDEIRKGVPFTKPLGVHLLRDRDPAELEREIQQFWVQYGMKLVFQTASN